MKPKMFASLVEAIEKWVEKQAETKDWSDLDFWCYDNMELHMAKAASLVFDAGVETSKKIEEETSEV